MSARTARRVLDRARGLLLAVALGLIVCGPLAAQCAMCRESAAYQRQEAIDSLQRGILILAFPPVAIIVGIACLTYRHRGTEHDLEPPPAPSHEE